MNLSNGEREDFEGAGGKCVIRTAGNRVEERRRNHLDTCKVGFIRARSSGILARREKAGSQLGSEVEFATELAWTRQQQTARHAAVDLSYCLAILSIDTSSSPPIPPHTLHRTTFLIRSCSDPRGKQASKASPLQTSSLRQGSAAHQTSGRE